MFADESNVSSDQQNLGEFYSLLRDTDVEQENASCLISTPLKFSRPPILYYLIKIEFLEISQNFTC